MDFPLRFEQSLDSLDAKSIAELKDSLNRPANTSIRFNTKKACLIPSELVLIPWAKSGYFLSKRPKFTIDPNFHSGKYYVQESSSMFLEQVFTHLPELQTYPIVALDLCAAPGGKSTHLLNLIGANSFLISNEVIQSRVGILRDNLTKWGNNNVAVTSNTALEFGQLGPLFDFILIDAPCSGEGMFRDLKAREEWSEENVTHCSIRQRKILSEIWPSLKDGGILAYSTCTFNRSENEQNISWLSSQSDFEIIDFSIPKNWGIVHESINGIKSFRFFPHLTPGEGFFMCVVRKKNGEHSKLPKPPKSNRKKHQKSAIDLDLFVQIDQKLEVNEINGKFYAFPSSHKSILDSIESLRLKKLGVCLGEFKGKQFIPHHELALSNSIKHHFPIKELSFTQALQFLKKADFFFESDKKGFVQVNYEGFGLGWVKHIGNRINNYLPNQHRILMDIEGYKEPEELI